MNEYIRQLFADEQMVERIKVRLPYLFQIAKLETSRGDRVGMEVGSVREKIITALLILKFGEENVKTGVPITEPEVDVEVFGHPISIKTFTAKKPKGVKLGWAVDAKKSIIFKKDYNPKCDMIVVHINWGNEGGFYYIPQETQAKVLKSIGPEKYVILPKQGTNARGTEMSSVAMQKLLTNNKTLKIPINWKEEIIGYKPFERWIELWQMG